MGGSAPAAESGIAGNRAMRLAIVCPRVPRRRELAIGPIDVEWVTAMSQEHDLELFVDHLSPLTDDLLALGIPVKESLKRWGVSDDGSYRSSDAFQARAILAAHRRRPFDAILHTSLAASDPAWLEPDLAAVPRGCALCGGASGDLRAVWQDEELFSHLARRLWAMTGLMASSDFLVADSSPESFGFLADAPFPPRLRSGARRKVARPEVPAKGLIALVATSAGAADFDDLLPRAIDLFAPDEELVFALLTPSRRPDANRLGAILESHRRLSTEQLVVVPAGPDGVAASFLDRAALVLLASPAELAVHGVAEVAERRGALLFDGSELAVETAPVLAKEHLRRRHRGNVHVISFGDLRSGVFADASDLGIESQDLIIVCSGGGDREATLLFQLGGMAGVDLVVWGRPAGPYGDADPGQVYPHAFAARAEIWPCVARAAEQAGSVWDLIGWALHLDRIDRARLIVLPVSQGSETRPLPPEPTLRAPWVPAARLLPAPRYVSAALTPPLPTPPLLAPPRPRIRETSSSHRTLEQWLRATTWPHRLRASLPWKWGLLERATRRDW